ncbi:hypothetical protein QSV08_06120 [Maribacter sp. BPC-D8]|uniref:DUF7638 domain-containing protein n=1 Tax=Maribacter sp. BPC-D8 TaxID=3053613 RepID=UPI002B4A875F|nr:hypothetical protein [Maribacter sp. BPC-D8]WRI30819.1 hypothetical protein QSV08_06120 [Maribacter sp. BPC-D8]
MKLFDKIFKKKNVDKTSDLTTITRTETFEGFSIPGIIHNMQYHFTDLQVYSDGLISCWEMVDLSILRNKINQGWIVTKIPNGEAISIFNLGNWYIEQGEWDHTKESLYEFISSLIKRLNPTLENLHNYNGNNSKKIGKVDVAKHFDPSPKPYHYDDLDSILPNKVNGEKFHFFYRINDNKTYLTELSIYESGRVELTNLPTKKVINFSDVKNLINEKVLVSDLKIGETVTILNLGSFKIKSGSGVDINFKLNELTDKLNELNGKENSITKCARIFEEYKNNPNVKLMEELKIAYEAVPEHKRIFVGTMDTKDYEVRQVIYGDIVKKEWEDDYGYEYPYDDMPEPKDK